MADPVPLNLALLEEDLAWQEGYRLTPYKDTKGFWSVGFGHNLDAHGQRHDRDYTAEECEAFFQADIIHVMALLDRHLPWWRKETEPRQRALANLMYNLGWGDGKHGLSSFKHSLAYFAAGEYDYAAKGFLNSSWANQVHAARAKAVTDLILHG